MLLLNAALWLLLTLISSLSLISSYSCWGKFSALLAWYVWLIHLKHDHIAQTHLLHCQGRWSRRRPGDFSGFTTYTHTEYASCHDSSAWIPYLYLCLFSSSFFLSFSPQVSSKNLNSHMSLKYRQIGQNAKVEVNERDLRKELDKKEEEYVKQKNKGGWAYDILLLANEVDSIQFIFSCCNTTW